MKTLKEQVEEVLSEKSSRTSKRTQLVKLGLRDYEVRMLLGTLPTTPRCKFNANNLTFGVEIECYNVIREQLVSAVTERHLNIQSQGYNHTDSQEFFKIVSDCSIEGNDANEIVSPILKGKEGETSLEGVCDSLNAVNAKVNKSTGLHVHFGASEISDKHFINIFKNYAKVEQVIDSFMPQSRRDNNNQYCKSIRRIDFTDCETKSDVIRTLHSRYYKVNAEAYIRHNTVEFRQHSGTTEFIKIQNWINFLRKLIQYSFDHEIERCSTIEEIPFLSDKDKAYFIERRNQLI